MFRLNSFMFIINAHVARATILDSSALEKAAEPSYFPPSLSLLPKQGLWPYTDWTLLRSPR